MISAGLVTYYSNNEAIHYCRLRDLLRSDDNVVVNDKNNQSDSCEQQHSVDVFPNEISADHTHWTSGDETDSDWASSPVKNYNRSMPKSLLAFATRKHAGAKRSLFSLDDSSQEQLAGMVKKSMGKLIVSV